MRSRSANACSSSKERSETRWHQWLKGSPVSGYSRSGSTSAATRPRVRPARARRPWALRGPEVLPEAGGASVRALEGGADRLLGPGEDQLGAGARDRGVEPLAGEQAR